MVVFVVCTSFRVRCEDGVNARHNFPHWQQWRHKQCRTYLVLPLAVLLRLPYKFCKRKMKSKPHVLLSCEPVYWIFNWSERTSVRFIYGDVRVQLSTSSSSSSFHAERRVFIRSNDFVRRLWARVGFFFLFEVFQSLLIYTTNNMSCSIHSPTRYDTWMRLKRCTFRWVVSNRRTQHTKTVSSSS